MRMSRHGQKDRVKESQNYLNEKVFYISYLFAGTGGLNSLQNERIITTCIIEEIDSLPIYKLRQRTNSVLLKIESIKRWSEKQQKFYSAIDKTIPVVKKKNCFVPMDSERIENKVDSEAYSIQATNQDKSTIIVWSPVDDKVLKYLTENPEALYHLSGNEFENIMAEIYSRLGYEVKKTKSTRDGGKDIIIKRKEIFGDFVYYVECKKYAANRPVGVGILRNLVGTISLDHVNGGILATTSYFTKDARDYIIQNNMQYQIKMQDYNDVYNLLGMVV